MSSPLQQIQISYDQLQDRMILTITTQDFSEYRFWITRRGLKGFWGLMQQLLEGDEENQLKHVKESQEASDKIQQEKEKRHRGAEQFAHHVAKYPLGNEPLLIHKFMGRKDKGHFFLRFEDKEGRSIEFGGTSAIILALCELIKKNLLTTDWALDL